MLVSLFLLIRLVSCPTVYALESNHRTTVANNNASELRSSSNLLNWRNTISQCVRLYTGPNELGDWFDICDSNELLSSMFVWRAQSMCTSGNTNPIRTIYWLIYERSHFTGPYILLGPSRCIDDIRQYKFLATTSILICVEIVRAKLDVLVSCQYPKQPWRQFFQVNWHSDNKVTSKQSVTVGMKSADEVKASSMENMHSLTELQKNSINNK
ncbi:unnamed protein product [Schistosoma rodhaini]|uniref:Interleukin-4 inducing immunoglobulin-binding domain-containing protein n=1 Tax=Schistosoma mansoni TaxID=6183 RepID=A0A5K4F9J2_SCHMA|nr:unnamed protein product [Schistosoma rodhaini]CAH8430971.1 unnamed protein product [Schistosoma rodhaini]